MSFKSLTSTAFFFRSVDVIIKNFEGTFPGGEILKVRPSDADVVGDYSCDLLEGSEAIFTVEKGCVVRAGRIQVIHFPLAS